MDDVSARSALRYAFHSEFQKLYLIFLAGVIMLSVWPLGFGFGISGIGSHLFREQIEAWLWILIAVILLFSGVIIALTSLVSIAYRFKKTT